MKLVKSKKFWIIGGGIALFVVTSLTVVVFFVSKPNYAEEVAKPIERSLAGQGASKMCSNGDGGYGSDNQTPYYGATFSLAENKEAAIELVQKVAAENGYELTHASTSNRGFIESVADEYIDDWYFDGSSKNSSYDQLRPGKIEFTAVVHGEGQKNDCDESIIKSGHSTIGIGISMPNTK